MVQERLRALDLPVLLVHGRVDPRPVAALEELAGCAAPQRAGDASGRRSSPVLEAPDALRQILQRFLLSLP
jgi:pimeloyl-ACP methyl ester carboxylesterase